VSQLSMGRWDRARLVNEVWINDLHGNAGVA
jgi:hypothetical protein